MFTGDLYRMYKMYILAGHADLNLRLIARVLRFPGHPPFPTPTACLFLNFQGVSSFKSSTNLSFPLGIEAVVQISNLVVSISNLLFGCIKFSANCCRLLNCFQ